MGEMGGKEGKWVEMGGNGGGEWGEMGENGKLLQLHHGNCIKMFQQERKMEENGVEKVGKWVKHGMPPGKFCIFPGPNFPIFPKDHQFPHRAI